MGIREQDPLKQGLKLNKIRSSNHHQEIREQDPLKQGLKQNEIEPFLTTKGLFVSKIH